IVGVSPSIRFTAVPGKEAAFFILSSAWNSRKQGSIVSDFRISLTLGGPVRTIRSHSRAIRPSPRDSSVTGPARRQGLDLKALDRIFERARAASCRIVLSETGDRRIIEAASWASREGLARICLRSEERRV